jgi:hypothetical protein
MLWLLLINSPHTNYKHIMHKGTHTRYCLWTKIGLYLLSPQRAQLIIFIFVIFSSLSFMICAAENLIVSDFSEILHS